MSTAYVTPGPLTPILTNGWGEERSWTLDSYRGRGGYQGLEKARTMEPAEIIQAVKDSGLRGRGGAGFPSGLKWSFLPPADGGPRYLVVNADESEPGTCKDIPLIMGNPHVLIEGIAITSRAIGCDHAFVYLRGEVTHVYRRLLEAVREATEAGVLGDLRITAHAGAGAYICGEETALLDSLEGRRGTRASSPPSPRSPACTPVPRSSTTSRPSLRWRASSATPPSGSPRWAPRSPRATASSPCRATWPAPASSRPPFGITMRELIEMAGGIREGHQLKFWTPGGSSTPIFTEDELDTPLDYESVGAAGSMLGTRALQVFDETVSVVRVITRWSEFYQHESCGKCTPCREGTSLDEANHAAP